MPTDNAAQLLPILALATCLLLALCAALALRALARLGALERQLARLDQLEGLGARLDRLAQAGEPFDLRRLEHVLIDVRDGLRRLEQRLLALTEARAGGAPSQALAQAAGGGELAGRVVERLLALGYERVQIVTPLSEIGALARGHGAVVVEARRDGAACKGRVHVAEGVLGEIEIQSAYSTFP